MSGKLHIVSALTHHIKCLFHKTYRNQKGITAKKQTGRQSDPAGTLHEWNTDLCNIASFALQIRFVIMMAQLMMQNYTLFHSRKIGFCTNRKRIDKVISIQFQYDFNSDLNILFKK